MIKIAGIERCFKIKTAIKLNINRIYLYRFSFTPKPLNFKDNRGISEISKYENNIINPIRIGLLNVKLQVQSSGFSLIQIRGNVRKNKVFAGVGRPKNESDCLESILNFANLKPEKTVIINPNKGKQDWLIVSEIYSLFEFKGPFKAKNKIIPGTNPKEIISANESNCFPNSDWTSSNLATKPSRKSKIAETRTRIIPEI